LDEDDYMLKQGEITKSEVWLLKNQSTYEAW
jgi:hypothetical protein